MFEERAGAGSSGAPKLDIVSDVHRLLLRAEIATYRAIRLAEVMRRFLVACLSLACALPGVAVGGPTTGLVSMPDARFNADGTLQFGLSYAHPYLSFNAAATLLPWLETNL